MSDHSELNRLAEAATPGPWAYDGSYVCPARTEDGTTYVELWRSIADCHQPENTKFIAAANPAAVLALIAEVEGLRAQHSRDSAELRSLCQARDDARKERDHLKADNEALRKDAELHQQIQRAAKDLPSGWEIRVCVERESGYVEIWDQDGCEVDFPNSCESLALTVSDAIDAAMSKGDQP